MALESSGPSVQSSKFNGVVIPHRLPWPKRLAGSVAYGVLRLLAATIRFEFEDHSGILRNATPQAVIFCTWHNRLALALTIYLKYPKKLHPARRLAAIVSASRDGAVMAYVLELFGAQPVRGSSSRRGAQALLELTSWAERGYDLAITPDGPRGPCYAIQEGVLFLAQQTGLPVVPMTYHLNWKVRLKSWDRFQIPLPWARCVVRFGRPVIVPKETSEADRETLRQRLEDDMNLLTQD